MTTDTRAIVAQLRELMERATPGEWRVGFSDGSGPSYITAGDRVVVGGCEDSWGIVQGMQNPDYAALIATTHNALPALLDHLERLEDVADVAPDTLHRGKAYNPKCCISCAAKAALNNALNALEDGK